MKSRLGSLARAEAAAEQLRRELAFALAPRAVTVGMVVAGVAQEFGVSLPVLLGDQRALHLVRHRHAAMALAQRLTGRSLPVIGRAMCRDHTSVLYGIRRHAEREALEPDFAARVAALSARLEERIKHV